MFKKLISKSKKSREEPRSGEEPLSHAVGQSESECESQWKKMFSLIRKEKWNRINTILDGPNSQSYCIGSDSTGLSVIGLAICCSAPLSIVRRILQINPSCTMDADNFGAVALHLACLNGAPADVIKLIIAHDNGVSVTIRDDDLRVPLHHAVEFAARLDLREDNDVSMLSSGIYSSSRSSVYSGPSTFNEDLEIIQALCESAPESVHFANNNNDTPMDILHVIRGMVETEEQHMRIESVYDIMKEASVQVYKRKRQGWESQRPDTMAMTKITDDQPSVALSSVTSSSSSTAPYSNRSIINLRHSKHSDSMNMDEQQKMPSSSQKRLNKEKMTKFGFHF